MKRGTSPFIRRFVPLAVAGILVVLLAACTGRGGGYLPPQSPVFTGQAAFGFTFSCENGDLKIELAYTDKGNGNGFHDLEADTVTLLDGTRASTASAGKEAHFAADLSDGERAAFLERHPHRLAFKHAHSKQNPEST